MARLNIAMLAQEAQAQEAVEQQSELDVVGQQAEDAIAEATQHQVEIEQTQAAIDETEEVLQEAEEERQVLEQAQQQGGAEPVAMEALQRAVKRFEKRTGVPCSVKSMGLESFSSKTTRMQSTKVAMEGAVDYIKKLIKMLMDAVAAVWEKVKAFVEKIWVGAERLAARADKVKELAKSAQGKTAPADAKVKSSSVLAYARANSKAVEGGEFVTAYRKQTNDQFVARKLSESATKDLINGATVAKIIEQAKKKDNKEELTSAIRELASSGTEGTAKDGLRTVASKDRLLGDMVATSVTIDKAATWDQISSGYKNLKTSISSAEGVSKDAVKEVSPLSPSEAADLANNVATNMRGYLNMRKDHQAIDAELKKLMSQAKTLEKEKDIDTEQLRVATGVVRKTVESTLQGIVAVRAYEINLSKAALDYAAASLNLAVGKKEENAGEKQAAKA